MANIPLKSISFPGLTNKYLITGDVSQDEFDALEDDVTQLKADLSELEDFLPIDVTTRDLLAEATLRSGYKIVNDGSLEAVSTYDVYEIEYDGAYEIFNAELYSNSTYELKAMAFYGSNDSVLSTVSYSTTSGVSEFVNQEVPTGTAKIYLCTKNTPASPSPSATTTQKTLDIHEVPSGGTSGQVLAKASDSDYDVKWITPPEASEIINDNSGIGDTDKTWSADKLTKEIGPISSELTIQPMLVDLLPEATHTDGKKLTGTGSIADNGNFEIYEMAYDGTYQTFNAGLNSNTNYDTKAIAFYGANDTVLSTVSYTTTSGESVFTDQTIPDGTIKIVLCNRKASGTVSISCLKDKSKRLSDIENDVYDNAASIETLESALTKITKNLFDASKTEEGIINENTGAVTALSGYICSDYIAVEANTIYSISGYKKDNGLFNLSGLRYAFYTDQKVYISGEYVQDGRFRTPSSAAFIRFSLSGTVGNIQLERRSFSTKYVPYQSYDTNDESDKMFLNLPNKVYSPYGIEHDIYMFNIVPEQYSGQYTWRFAKDNAKIQNYGRLLRVKNNSNAGQFAVIFEATSPNKCGVKKINVVVSDPQNLDSVSVLILGDSTTANGYVAQYLHEYVGSENDIQTLGTLGTAPYNHEGRSGWSLTDYFTKSDNNPFYNPTTQTFDASYYFSQTNVSVPDVFIINLGINDMHYNSSSLVDAIETANGFIEKVNYVISSLRTVDANIKVAICLTIPPNVDPWGFGAAGTSIINYDQYRIANLVLCDKLIDTYDYRENEGLYLIPINTCLDTKYNMPAMAQLPNVYASEQIMLPDTAGNVHPNAGGYHQIADGIFAFLCSL